MIRPIKKMCSVMLAVSLVWTAVSVPASANTKESGNDSGWYMTDDVVTFVEPNYDDECCVWGEDEIAFVENGEWYEEADLETNIVFVDKDGVKKTVSNNNGKGVTLFDEIYPVISDYRMYANVLELVKGNQITFMNFHGEYVGGVQKYYNYAEPITEDVLLASDDGISYKVINKKGEVTVDNIKNINNDWQGIFDNACIYILCDNNFYILDRDGNLLNELGEAVECYAYGQGYDIFTRISDGKKIAINIDGKIIKEFDDSYEELYVEYTNYYLKYVKKVEENGKLVDKYFLMDVLNDKILTETYSEITTNGNLIISQLYKDTFSLYDVDGNIYVEDIDELFYELLIEEGGVTDDGAQIWVENKYNIYENKFIATLAFGSDRDVTYVYTWSEDGSKCDVKRFEGQYLKMLSEYIVTRNCNGYLKKIYTLTGELIKTFEGNIYEDIYYLGVGEILFKVCADWDNDYKKAYILSTGELIGDYSWITGYGEYIYVEDYDSDSYYIINSKNEIIFEERFDGRNIWCTNVSSENLSAFMIEDYDAREAYIYDVNGRLLFSGKNIYTMDFDSDYVLIVNEKEENRKYGALRISDNIAIDNAKINLSAKEGTYSGKEITPSVESVIVNNEVLTEGKDYTVSYKNNVKVGKATVVITGKGDYTGTCSTTFDIVYGTGMYKGTDGKWYYYVNGKVDTSYIGLAKNAYGWWYMNKGKLDTSYTGLVKYKTNWVYVSNGKLDSSYTGLVKYKSNWVYVKKGKLDATYTGLVKYKSNWVYVKKGKLDASYTGLVKYKSNWVYVNKGKLDTSFTGMAKNPYGWWYVTKGKLDLTYTGIAKNAYGTWYLQKGKLDLTFSGKVTVDGVKYTIKNGKVK